MKYKEKDGNLVKLVKPLVALDLRAHPLPRRQSFL